MKPVLTPAQVRAIDAARYCGPITTIGGCAVLTSDFEAAIARLGLDPLAYAELCDGAFVTPALGIFPPPVGLFRNTPVYIDEGSNCVVVDYSERGEVTP